MSLREHVRAERQRYLDLPELSDADTNRAIRQAAGFSQERAAELIGVHRMTLVRWENGTTEATGWVDREAYRRFLAHCVDGDWGSEFA